MKNIVILTMGDGVKKGIIKRLLNTGILFKYLGESAGIVRQGATLRDKLTLFSYFLKIPAIVLKSLSTRKTFREIEEQKKFLRRDITIKNRHGLFHCGHNMLTVYTVNEHNEKHIYPFTNFIDGVFIDVGAHIGKYSIAVARNLQGRVIAIEPDKYNFSLLKKNIALNSHKNIIAVNMAAYSSTTKIPFYTTGQGEGMHSLIKQENSREEELVEADTLDRIAEQYAGNDPVRLIKIDVEGAEQEVMKGAQNILRKDRPGILIEIWKNNQASKAFITEYLRDFGYTCTPLDEENYYFSVPGYSGISPRR